MKHKLFTLFLLTSGLVFAYELPDVGYFAQWQKTPSIKEKEIALFVHSSTSFDHKAQARTGAVNLSKYLRDEVEIKTISIDHSLKRGAKSSSTYYVVGKDVDIPVRSKYGNHHLQLTGLNLLVMAGGYFEICFKNAFRDVLEKSTFSNDYLDVHFVTDAIYRVNPSAGSAISLKASISSFDTKKKIVKYLNNSFMKHDDVYHHLKRNERIKNLVKGGVILNYYIENELIQSEGSGRFTINIKLTKLENLSL